MNIYIASDHKGFKAESEIVLYLKDMGINILQINTNHDDSDDYPDYAFPLCKKVLEDKGAIGILLCGTGIGMSICANKVKGIRAARCVNKDEAFLARNHNDANVLCIGVSLDMEKIKEIIDTFINTSRSFEDRHINRVNKIINYENGAYNEL